MTVEKVTIPTYHGGELSVKEEDVNGTYYPMSQQSFNCKEKMVEAIKKSDCPDWIAETIERDIVMEKAKLKAGTVAQDGEFYYPRKFTEVYWDEVEKLMEMYEYDWNTNSIMSACFRSQMIPELIKRIEHRQQMEEQDRVMPKWE